MSAGSSLSFCKGFEAINNNLDIIFVFCKPEGVNCTVFCGSLFKVALCSMCVCVCVCMCVCVYVLYRCDSNDE